MNSTAPNELAAHRLTGHSTQPLGAFILYVYKAHLGDLVPLVRVSRVNPSLNVHVFYFKFEGLT